MWTWLETVTSKSKMKKELGVMEIVSIKHVFSSVAILCDSEKTPVSS